MNNTLQDIDLTRTLPPSLKQDPKIIALAQIVAEELQKTSTAIPQCVIYPRIDELGEELLDVLAYDLHVDWYDYSYPIEVKRATIKDSVKVHRRLGTKYAVKTAIGNVFPGSSVTEWFEYGGKPYYFKLFISASDSEITLSKKRQLLEGVTFYKNLRSRLEGIQYIIKRTCAVDIVAITCTRRKIEVWPAISHDVTCIGSTIVRRKLEVYP